MVFNISYPFACREMIVVADNGTAAKLPSFHIQGYVWPFYGKALVFTGIDRKVAFRGPRNSQPTHAGERQREALRRVRFSACNFLSSSLSTRMPGVVATFVLNFKTF
jgi:hypothetical protein